MLPTAASDLAGAGTPHGMVEMLILIRSYRDGSSCTPLLQLAYTCSLQPLLLRLRSLCIQGVYLQAVHHSIGHQRLETPFVDEGFFLSQSHQTVLAALTL